ncbi:MAG: hypothetical protein KHZ77_03395 [Veillonella sp.]|uniref:hypothetical protein n=1 Tax=Veillonella sp. TaxID=1926307 RepID=UPI0025FEB980|nr:hypothetical protein [Veillonella sp.]MBS4913194.1 hypothetical protein [Veillonella sp.]
MFVHLSDTYSISMDEIIAVVQTIPLIKGKRRRNKQWNNAKVIHVFPDEPIESYLVTKDTIYGLSMSITGVGKRLAKSSNLIPVSLYTKK